MLEIEKYLNEIILNRKLTYIKDNISVYDFKFDNEVCLSVNNKCYFSSDIDQYINHNIVKINVILDKEIRFTLDNSLTFFIGLDEKSADTPEVFLLSSKKFNIYLIYNNFNEIFEF